MVLGGFLRVLLEFQGFVTVNCHYGLTIFFLQMSQYTAHLWSNAVWYVIITINYWNNCYRKLWTYIFTHVWHLLLTSLHMLVSQVYSWGQTFTYIMDMNFMANLGFYLFIKLFEFNKLVLRRKMAQQTSLLEKKQKFGAQPGACFLTKKNIFHYECHIF